MKKFILDPSFLELFPESRIGVLVCKDIDNHVKEEERYAPWLRECEKVSAAYIANPEFTENETIRNWRDAFYRFKTKKGARCSIEALLKRVSKGGEIGCINPLVDLYNGISLKYGMPVGGDESVRTMLTEEVTNAFMIIETVQGEFPDRLEGALDELAAKIEAELGGSVEKFIVDKENPQIEIG